MSTMLWWWYSFLRYGEIINLDAARKSENWEAKTDCRLRITALDRKLEDLKIN